MYGVCRLTPALRPNVYTHLFPFRISGCIGPKDFQANAKSTIRCRPTHMVLGAWRPSHLRFRYPPRLATIMVKSPRDGGVSGGASFLAIIYTGFHSSSSKSAVHGKSRHSPSKHGNKQYPPCHYHIKSNTRFDTPRCL